MAKTLFAKFPKTGKFSSPLTKAGVMGSITAANIEAAKNAIGHFRVTFGLWFKAHSRVKPFIWRWVWSAWKLTCASSRIRWTRLISTGTHQVSSSIKVLPFAYEVDFVDRSTDTILATRFRWIRLKNTTFLTDGCHLKRKKKQRQTVRFFWTTLFHRKVL